MNSLYFSLEDIDTGLFESQVMNTVIGIKNENPDIKITLLIINRPWKAFNVKVRLEQIRRDGIGVIYLPLLPPLRWFSSGKIFTYFYVFYLWLVLKLFVDLKQYQLIHCRNYLPALVIRKFKKSKFLFDIRSLHAYEYVQANKIKFNSNNYNYWLSNEKKLLDSAAAVTVVSRGMIGYLQNIVNRNIDYCPITSNYNIVYFDPYFRNKIRKELGWESNNIYVYSGSFGLYGLNKEYLIKMMKFILANDDNARFLFLISNSADELAMLLKESNIADTIIHSKSVKLNQLSAYLSAADIGIHALPKQLDAFTRLGTKVVEYWSAGLPVLINDHIGEAAAICEQLKLGKVISLELNTMTYASKFDISEVIKMDRLRVREQSKAIFSTSVVARSYVNVYSRFY